MHGWKKCGDLDILYWFIGGQTHYAMLRGSIMSLAPNESK